MSERRFPAIGLAVGLLSLLAVSPAAWAAPEHQQHAQPQAEMQGTPGMKDMQGMQNQGTPADLDVQAPVDPNIPTFTLDDLERRALEHNPATAAAEAAVRAADGRRLQAGLYPNPVIGYSGDDVSLQADRNRGKHGFFVSQEVPLGGKLRLSRQILARDLEEARVVAGAQPLVLRAEVQTLFHRTLAAQRRVEVREHLAALARQAVEVTGQLFNTGSADAPDRLAIENEASLIESGLAAARVELDQLWAALRAVVADPKLEPGRLQGDLAAGLPDLDREQWRQRLLQESPELRIAAIRAARAEAALARARAARTPDLVLNGGIRRDRELVGPGGPAVGNEAFGDIGLRLPIWNRNQGGIAAAEADLARARLEQERLRLDLEARFAGWFSRYRQAAQRAATFREGVLGRGRQAYELYLTQYRQMMAAYPQVLIAQRTLYQLENDYIDSLDRAWEAAVGIQSLLLTDGQSTSGGMGMGGASGGMGSTMVPQAMPVPGGVLQP